jgi:hypothetical protein
MHDDFKCLNPRDYLDTKSWLAFEQNPYLTHWVRSGSCCEETSLCYDSLPAITRLRANMNIIGDWHVNPTSSHCDNTPMLWHRGAAHPYHNQYNLELQCRCQHDSAVPSLEWLIIYIAPRSSRLDSAAAALSPAWLGIYIVPWPNRHSSAIVSMTRQRRRQDLH